MPIESDQNDLRMSPCEEAEEALEAEKAMNESLKQQLAESEDEKTKLRESVADLEKIAADQPRLIVEEDMAINWPGTIKHWAFFLLYMVLGGLVLFLVFLLAARLWSKPSEIVESAGSQQSQSAPATSPQDVPVGEDAGVVKIRALLERNKQVGTK